MYKLAMWVLLSSLAAAANGCTDDAPPDKAPVVAARATPRHVLQVPAPSDLQKPPADATKTASGLLYRRLVANTAGPQLAAGRKALVRYTGWRQRTGETFFTTNGADHPVLIDPAHTAPGFRDVLPLLHRGEKMMLWLPSAPGTSEPVAYEVELVDVIAAKPS